MQAAGLPEIVIRTFAHYYAQLVEGQTGLIPEETIEPARNLPDMETFGSAYRQAGRKALSRTVLVKLNGGLGTGMGMQGPKTLLPVKDGLTFLDVIARHALHAGVPLILMNSFATRRDTLAALEPYPALWDTAIGIDFLQHRFPKIRQSDLAPAEHPEAPEHSWNPPGHGDLYTALVTSGMLARLLEAGFEFAFVSNGDNLGASLDPDLLGYFVHQELPFMMEVAHRTPADRKGGHLAVRRGGGLVLRESAQCPPDDETHFQDVHRHAYFNTNNLWLHLPSLDRLLKERNNVLGLPLIRNRKTLDPRDPQSTPVFQLETAMGSAISVFEGAGAVCVPRARFSPVKTTDDLLAVRSDAYTLTPDFRIVPARPQPPNIMLDPRYFKLVDQLDARFPAGAPSLIDCTRLVVEGDVVFGAGVVVSGAVEICAAAETQHIIPDGSHLTGQPTS